MTAKFTVTSNADKWVQSLRAKQQDVANAAVMALREVAADAVQEGRRSIAASGRFGAAWQRDLLYSTKDAIPPTLQAKAVIFHKSALAGVFEHGARIEGKPLLWIPTTPGAPTPSKSGKVLTSATVRGTPVLFDARDKDPHRKPLYIGVKEANIPPKWHIAEIAARHMKDLGRFFIKFFKG